MIGRVLWDEFFQQQRLAMAGHGGCGHVLLIIVPLACSTSTRLKTQQEVAVKVNAGRVTSRIWLGAVFVFLYLSHPDTRCPELQQQSNGHELGRMVLALV